MGSMVSLLLTALIGMGIYTAYFKHASPAGDIVATQAISTTGMQMDLMAIAQAERAFYVQNNTYADLDQLASGGIMNINRDGRDGYAYSVDASSGGFVVTARHADSPPSAAGGPGLHFPTISVDESMQVRQGE